MFNDPSAGGDKLPLDDLTGSLLLFTVQEALTDVQTSFGPSNPVRADVAVLDGPKKGETYDDALVFPRVLASSLRPHVGAMVLGRLGRGQAKPGQLPPWLLTAATAEEKQTGEKYLQHVAATKVADPVSEPF